MLSRNESDETLTVVESTLPEGVTFNHLAPYAKYMYSNECNKKMRSLKNHEKVSFLSNGHLFLEDDTKVRIYDRGFCVDNFYTPATNSSDQLLFMSAFICRNETFVFHLDKSNVTRCTMDMDLIALNQKMRFWLTLSGFVSIFFLLLTLLFYITLPDLGNFQGNIICAYILSIILTTSVLIIIYNVKLQTYREIDDDVTHEFNILISKGTCQFLGYLLYFSGILMFCWMSVLCFDLFWTFVCTPGKKG